MHPERNVQAVLNAAMNRIQKEYAQLNNSLCSFSLLNMFNSDDFQFDLFCADFSPHPNIGELKKSTINFGEKYEILLPNAEHYITCAMFLFPAAPLEKIILLSKNYAVDFYLNDTMGRDAKPTTDEKKLLNEIRDRLASIGNDLNPDGNVSFAERANIEILNEISKASPFTWFDGFLRLYLYHIDVAHQSFDAVSLDRIQTIEEYIDMRCYISGMPHSVSLIEFSNNVFLDWELLDRAGVAEEVKKANWTVSLIGALTNDLFSFEKEVIDQHSDSNLIVLILLNNFRMKLTEAIKVASAIIQDLLIEYNNSSTKIRNILSDSSILTDETRENLQIYMNGLKSVLQACWTWQTYTQRYKRINSIWRETAQKDKIAI